MLLEALGNRKAAVCRELTKKHESIFNTCIEDALCYYRENEPRGECVIVVEGKSFGQIQKEEQAQWEDVTVEEHMELYLKKRCHETGSKRQGSREKRNLSGADWSTCIKTY